MFLVKTDALNLAHRLVELGVETASQGFFFADKTFRGRSAQGPKRVSSSRSVKSQPDLASLKGKYKSILDLYRAEPQALKQLVPQSLRDLVIMQSGKCLIKVKEIVEKPDPNLFPHGQPIKQIEIHVTDAEGNIFAVLAPSDTTIDAAPVINMYLELRNPLLTLTDEWAKAHLQPKQYHYGKLWPGQQYPGLPATIYQEICENLKTLGQVLGKKYLLFQPQDYHTYFMNLKQGFFLSPDDPEYAENKKYLDNLEMDFKAKGIKGLWAKSWYAYQKRNWPAINLLYDLSR